MTLRWLALSFVLVGCSGMEAIDDVAITPCKAGVAVGVACDATATPMCETNQGQVFYCQNGTWGCAGNVCLDLSAPTHEDMKTTD
jgi:hypothetical protein